MSHYGLAPQHDYREAYSFVTAVYRELISELIPANVAVVGDSAGGGLALGLARSLAQEEGLAALPGRLVLISPWLDLNLRDPGIPAAEARDPWLAGERLRVNGRSWAGGDDPALPKLSPINGPMAPLPPTDIYIGTRDLLHPDVLCMAKAAAAAGSAVNLTVCEGAVHVYLLLPAPEGRSAAQAIVHGLAQLSATDLARSRCQGVWRSAQPPENPSTQGNTESPPLRMSSRDSVSPAHADDYAGD